MTIASSKSLKITLVISLLWHVLCLVMFEPTLGKNLKRLDFAGVSFLGNILKKGDLNFEGDFENAVYFSKGFFDCRIKQIIFKISRLNKKDNAYFTYLKEEIRPTFGLDFNKKKIICMENLVSDITHKYKKESTLVFYPRLPHSFLFYFKDRQKAHIEFTFYISDKGKVGFINRKISSGNLEADLLASRYITRCLNLVEGQFPFKTWQTVKIDLTRKND